MHHKFSELSCALEKDQLTQSQFFQFSELIFFAGWSADQLSIMRYVLVDCLGNNSFEIDSIYKSLFVIIFYDVMAGMYIKLTNI